MDIKVAYGKRVRQIRKDKGVSQEKLAELAELDRTYISDIENGKRNVSIETVYKIAKALDISLKYFFGFD
jgi:transcriptional regulator with XRE-family HTH domain